MEENEEIMPERNIRKTIKVYCRICQRSYPARLEAENEDEMLDLEKDIKEYFICQACHDNPENREAILDILGIPDPFC